MDSFSSRIPLDHIIEESKTDESPDCATPSPTEKKSVSSAEVSLVLPIEEESFLATSWVQPIDEWGAESKEFTSIVDTIKRTQGNDQGLCSGNTKAELEGIMHISGDAESVIDGSEKNYPSTDKSIEEVADQLQKQFICKDNFTNVEKQNDGDMGQNEAVSPEKEETIVHTSLSDSVVQEQLELRQGNETENFVDLLSTENSILLMSNSEENLGKSNDTMTFEQIEQKIMSKKDSLENEMDIVGSIEAQCSYKSSEENRDVGKQTEKEIVNDHMNEKKEEMLLEKLESEAPINIEKRKIVTNEQGLSCGEKIRPNSIKDEKRIIRPPTTRIPSASTRTPVSLMPKTVSPVITRRPPAPTTRTSSTTWIPDGGIMPSRSQSQPRAGSYTALNSLRSTPKVNKRYVNVTSKIGSITDHKPSGGNVEIFSEKKVIVGKAKVGSMEKADHVPGGGNVKIENVRINFKEKAKPRVDSKSNHCPTKSDKKIISQKLNWNVQPKIGSMENAKHKPTGGNVKILNQKLEWSATSKVGSKTNINHRPGGGNVQVDTLSGRGGKVRVNAGMSRPSLSDNRSPPMPGASDPLTAEQIMGNT